MALSNEDKAEIRKMIREDRSELLKTVREELKRMIPEMFGRSMEQLRAFFISSIT